MFGSGLLSQYVMPHVKQVIIDAKEGPPKYEEGMAIDIFSVVRYQHVNALIICSFVFLEREQDDVYCNYFILPLIPDAFRLNVYMWALRTSSAHSAPSSRAFIKSTFL